MRVAILSCNAQRGDAIGNNVAEKVRFFRDHGADVRVFLQTDRHLHPALSEHYRVASGADLPDDEWSFLSLADLICVEFGQYYPLLSLLPMLAGAKARIMIDYHGITPPDLWGGHNREALVLGLQHRGLAWLADVSITHSTFTHRELVDVTHLPPERLPRLGFPIDCSWFAAGENPRECRRALGLEGNRVLLYVGRMAPNKRPVLLVEALAHLTDLSPDVHAVFVGDCGDLYAAEAQKCLERARQLGLSDRVHLVGPQCGTRLRDYYRAAAVLVVSSQWESFCIPVIEAMAAGLPVVAARSTALPETIAGAGLSFIPGDSADMARQLRRVLQSDTGAAAVSEEGLGSLPRIAVIALRYGADFASGAEASLRKMARALGGAGCHVEVFTSTTQSEKGDSHDHAVGTAIDSGIVVHRLDPLAIVDAVRDCESTFDFLLTGPYLSKFTAAVAERWPEKTIVMPCFHDEPDARSNSWAVRYERVAGVIYHSQEEKEFAECGLGFNHPGATVVDTHVDMTKLGDASRGRQAVGAEHYVVYCGRYVEGKNLPLLLDYARRFDSEFPRLLRFVFTGQGEIQIPREPWAVDLGFVTEDTMRNVLAGASGLVQLSCNESLSLAALEAWAQGTPVIAHRRCEVLKGQIERSGAGLMVESYEDFAAALKRLLLEGSEMGMAGQAYVREKYGCAVAFRQRLLSAVCELKTPLCVRMRKRGLERAAEFDKSVWRQQFGALVESVLDGEPLPGRQCVVVKFRRHSRLSVSGGKSVLLSVRIANEGTFPAIAEGPGRTVVAGVILDAAGQIVHELTPTPIPLLIMPGQIVPGSLALSVPEIPGEYIVRIWAVRADTPDHPQGPYATVSLGVLTAATSSGDDGAEPRANQIPSIDASEVSLILEEAQTALVEAHRLRRLPDDYTDVTQGLFAKLKRGVKQKFLGNFKKAYVDVLSRQQSACNQQLVTALQTLSECCATLAHAVQVLQERQTKHETRSTATNDRLGNPVRHEIKPRQPIP